MAVLWPSDIAPAVMSKPRLVNGQARITGPNGVSQLSASAAHLWEVDFSFPPLTKEQAGKVEGVLAAAQSDVLRIGLSVPAIRNLATMTNFELGSTWSSGKAATISQGSAGHDILDNSAAGLWFSVVTSGRSYLYVITGNATTGGPNRVMPVSGLPRASHASSSAVNLDAPMIEGIVSVSGGSVDVDLLTKGLSITVSELR